MAAPFVPPVITPLPQAADMQTVYNDALTAVDSYGLTLEDFWLGQIADSIKLAARSGKKYTTVEFFKITPTIEATLTGAGYTIAPMTLNANISGQIISIP